MAGHLILLGIPCERHIPYFAMPVPRSRESYAQRLDIKTDLVGFVGRRCAAWVRARAEIEHQDAQLRPSPDGFLRDLAGFQG
jgi:hypothetical protein